MAGSPSARVTSMTFSASAFSLAAMRMRCAAFISFMAARTLLSGSMSVTCTAQHSQTQTTVAQPT